jgi:hypothetical protein
MLIFLDLIHSPLVSLTKVEGIISANDTVGRTQLARMLEGDGSSLR